MVRLFGDQRLDGHAHLGKHALVLGADVPRGLVCVQIAREPRHAKARLVEIAQRVLKQVGVVALEPELRAVGQKIAVLHQLARVRQAVLFVAGLCGSTGCRS